MIDQSGIRTDRLTVFKTCVVGPSGALLGSKDTGNSDLALEKSTGE